MIIICAIF